MAGFTLLARSKSPSSPLDKEDVRWFVAQHRDGIPGSIPSAPKVALSTMRASFRHAADDGTGYFAAEIRRAAKRDEFPLAG